MDSTPIVLVVDGERYEMSVAFSKTFRDFQQDVYSFFGIPVDEQWFSGLKGAGSFIRPHESFASLTKGDAIVVSRKSRRSRSPSPIPESEWRSQSPQRRPEFIPPPHDIIFNGDLFQARSEALRLKKWILYSVQRTDDDLCSVMNDQIWSHETVKSLIKAEFLFVQDRDGSRIAQQFSNYYRCLNPELLPHTCILDPRSGERTEKWDGLVDIQTMIDSLSDHASRPITDDLSKPDVFISNEAKRRSRSSSPVPIRGPSASDDSAEYSNPFACAADGYSGGGSSGHMDVTKVQQELERHQRRQGGGDSAAPSHLIAEQNMEYLASLQQDMIKDEQKRKEAEEKRRQQELEELRQRMEEEKHRMDNERRQKKRTNMPPEPMSGTPSSRVQIRLPNGARIERFFSPEDTISHIFDLLDINEIDPQDHELVTTFPTRKYSSSLASDLNKTLKGEGLVPNASFNVGTTKREQIN